MIVSTVLTAILALFTFRHWQHVVLPSMLAHIVDTPFRYCYTSTVWRYSGIMAVYGFIFFTLIWGSAFLLSNILWPVFSGNDLSRANWTAVSLPVLVLGVYGLCWLPGLRNITLGVHRTVMRHLFFPIIPSSREDFAINQLLQATEALDEGDEFSDSLPMPDHADERAEIQRQVHSMIVLYNKLFELFNRRGNHLKLMLYGEEWSLIHNLYQAIIDKLRHQPESLSPELLNTIQLCQYYCCHLLVHYWFTTTFSDEKREDHFKQVALHG